MELKKEKGFTLVELSIVLVIIGLIVGGVLVGQDLINAARIRAMVSQFEKIDAGGSTFQAKYGSRPGDIAAARATAFGLTAPGGDGNGVVQNAGTANHFLAADEISNFWDHLTEAALIPGVATNEVPATQLGKGYIHIASKSNTPQATDPNDEGSLLYYYISTVGPAPADGDVAIAGIMTPQEAFGIDSKLDDGLPGTGQVLADGGTSSTATQPVAPTPGTANTNCTSNATTPDQYRVAGENNTCSVLVRAQS